jgi:hypothetical protein
MCGKSVKVPCFDVFGTVTDWRGSPEAPTFGGYHSTTKLSNRESSPKNDFPSTSRTINKPTRPAAIAAASVGRLTPYQSG